MNDQEAAFLAEILARPEGDGPRLLFADYLDERGDPRGEFIRVQVALAWAPSCPACANSGFYPQSIMEFREGLGMCGVGSRQAPCWKCQRESLRRRERELLAEDGPPVHGVRSRRRAGGDWEHQAYRWMGRAVLAASDWCEFRRGFPEVIECTAEAFLAHADALVKAAPLRGVRLTTWPVAEQVGRHRGYTPYGRSPLIRYGRSPLIRWRLPGRRREMTSVNTAAEAGETLLRLEWDRIDFTLPA